MDTNEPYGLDYEFYMERRQEEPEAPFQSEGKYYHYTSLDSCLKMLDHKDGVFEMWASHLAYLNDKEEHKDGLQLIERKIDDLLVSKREELSDWGEDYKEKRSREVTLSQEIFVICFCSERNLLSQWKYYGKNCGVAIQYNLDNCVFSGFVDGAEEGIVDEERRYWHNFARKVVYDNLKKQEIVDLYIKDEIYKVFDDPNKDLEQKKRKIDSALDRLYGLAPLFKHSSFDEEHESRLLFQPMYISPKKDAGSLIYYRTSDGKVIPYMKIKIRGRKEETGRLPVIKSLTVGPGQNQDLVFDALVHFVKCKFPAGSESLIPMEKRDYSYVKVNGVEIRKSFMPFRG